VFFMTMSGALWRLDVSSGAMRQIIAETPVGKLLPPFTVAAGSIVRVTTSGVKMTTASAQSTPLPETLGGIRLWVSETPAPLLSVAPGEVRFQVPWYWLATPGGIETLTLEFDTDSDSRFTAYAGAVMTVTAVYPRLETLGQYVIAAHTTFDS